MLTRPLWIALGLIATLLGVLGIVLPLVPTTPFLLLAALAFSRSSPVLHERLMSHPHLGRYIRHWQQYGCIDRPVKYSALGLMLAALTISALTGISGWILAVQILVIAAVGAFIMTRPDTPAD